MHDKLPCVEFRGKHIPFYPHSHACLKRVANFATKEPDTVAWIGELGSDDVLWDVGANIGIYSIPAAYTGAAVVAIEPEVHTFSSMCDNISLNGLHGKVIPILGAISDRTGVSSLVVSSIEPGSSLHSIDPSWGFNGKKPERKREQSVLAFTSSDLLRFGLPRPTRIKIDVDGLEPLVVIGLADVIGTADSVLLETDSNDPRHGNMSMTMESLGFSFSMEQVKASRRMSGPSAGVGNVIWRKS